MVWSSWGRVSLFQHRGLTALHGIQGVYSIDGELPIDMPLERLLLLSQRGHGNRVSALLSHMLVGDSSLLAIPVALFSIRVPFVLYYVLSCYDHTFSFSKSLLI